MHFDDPQKATSFLSDTCMPLRVDVPGHAARDFDFETMAVQCEGVKFSNSTSRSGMRLIVDEPADGYGMSFPSSGSLSVDSGAGQPTDSKPSGGLILDSLTARSATFSPGSAWQRIALSSEELHRHVTLLTEQPVHRRVKFEPHFSMESGAASLMFEIGQAIIDGMRCNAPLHSAPAAIVSLKEAVLSMFVEAMPHDYSSYLGRRTAMPAPKHVRRAIEFMHANLLRPLRLEDIAVASQTSARALQMGFRQFRDTTPMDYLRRLRLDGARNELIHCPPGTSVADVAYRWGFAHHGMFASRYAKLFGEPPSATLRRHRKT
ncbi:MAG TPA: AraC family transcriptional regulator [Variovorax sp.]|nr:AraC family transcriptional regulator [Variovorax sp.]